MPNWCYNLVEIEGKKEEVIRFLNDLIAKPQIICREELNIEHMSDAEKLVELERLKNLEKECVTYSKIMPQPDSVLLGKEPWYDWRLKNWGVKWDISDLEVSTIKDAIDEASECDDYCHTSFDYDTPWCAPEQFYAYATLHYDIEVTLSSEEPGVCIYQKKSIEKGEVETVFDTEVEMIWRYEMGDSINECLCYYLEPNFEVLVSTNDEGYWYLLEAVNEFRNYLVAEYGYDADGYNYALKDIIKTLANNLEERNLVVSRLLPELVEKVAISN